MTNSMFRQKDARNRMNDVIYCDSHTVFLLVRCAFSLRAVSETPSEAARMFLCG